MNDMATGGTAAAPATDLRLDRLADVAVNVGLGLQTGQELVMTAPLEALPLGEASCDAALLVLALAYLTDPLPALREAARILKPAGRLVVVDALRHDDEPLRRRMGQVRPGFLPDELAALLARS